MPPRVAFLRAVNVGGRWVAMPVLREFLAGQGLTNVRSLLQSGNLVFDAGSASPAELEDLLERELLRQLHLASDVFVRTGDELAAAIAANPFPAEAERDPAHLLVIFLKAAPKPAGLDALRSAVPGPELVEPGQRHLYVYYPAGIGRSKLTNALIERKLGASGTGRNWNTALKLLDLARG